MMIPFFFLTRMQPESLYEKSIKCFKRFKRYTSSVADSDDSDSDIDLVSNLNQRIETMYI